MRNVQRCAADATDDLAQRIGSWAEHFVPGAARTARIRASVRDFMGCVVAGTRRPELRPALWLANGGGVPVWGLTESFDPAGAALVTAMAGALLQLHDFYAPGASHPSAPVIAAAWSASQADPALCPGIFLRAVAAGYETANRFAAACGPAQIRAGSTPTSAAGSIGAAVAAGLIRGLDGRGIGRAVANAAMLLPLSPLAGMRAHGSLTPLHCGLAARAGYEAASLAREADAGWRVVEGDECLPGLVGVLGGNPLQLVPDEWDGETIDEIAWKFFPACQATHLALEAVLRLGAIDTRSIRRVLVRQPPGLLDSVITAGPTTGELYDRLMSLRWVLARALETRHCDYPEAIAGDARTMELSRRIDFHCDSGLVAQRPDTLCVSIDVHTDSGLRHIDYQRSARADADSPGPSGWTRTLDELRLRRKFDALVGDKAPLAGSLAAMGVI